jgi:Cu-Zn family superoxide dismutase
MNVQKYLIGLAAAVGAILSGTSWLVAQQHEAHAARVTHGVSVISPASGSEVKGKLMLVQQEGGLQVRGEIGGLKPGLHGFHIHEFGDLSSPDGTAAGGHFNPEGHEHGGPEQAQRHAGDLGNIRANEQGVAQIDITVPGLQLESVLGRAIVVHADPDDLKSQPSGNAGARIGLGIIGVTKPPAAR